MPGRYDGQLGGFKLTEDLAQFERFFPKEAVARIGDAGTLGVPGLRFDSPERAALFMERANEAIRKINSSDAAIFRIALDARCITNHSGNADAEEAVVYAVRATRGFSGLYEELMKIPQNELPPAPVLSVRDVTPAVAPDSTVRSPTSPTYSVSAGDKYSLGMAATPEAASKAATQLNNALYDTYLARGGKILKAGAKSEDELRQIFIAKGNEVTHLWTGADSTKCD
jgi:hypothetical protein